MHECNTLGWLHCADEYTARHLSRCYVYAVMHAVGEIHIPMSVRLVHDATPLRKRANMRRCIAHIRFNFDDDAATRTLPDGFTKKPRRQCHGFFFEPRMGKSTRHYFFGRVSIWIFLTELVTLPLTLVLAV